ncbi:hypothetical protein Fmac_006015 [Flemingia macrophylla]|uniref:NAD(P)-binding domain-containing protein n=1 Tax=Flemingia macrophylla TaxID=520843 RepID=A0ABD1N9F5_9FABA
MILVALHPLLPPRQHHHHLRRQCLPRRLPNSVDDLLPAIANLYLSLLDLGIRKITVSTSSSFATAMSYPYPLLLPGSATPPPDATLFTPSSGPPFNFRKDFTTGVRYRNLFDVMVDAIISALVVAGYETVPVGGIQWEKQVRTFAQIHRQGGISVLVTGATGFVGSHVSLALKRRGDDVLSLDNFNDYYDPSLKKARKSLISTHDVFVVEADVNDAKLLAKLFDVVAFTHVMHLAAQAEVRYAMENPHSYVHSNIADLKFYKD